MLDEQGRYRLIDAFRRSHGEDTAMALAESLFSTEFATKADLKALEARLEARLDGCATKADLKALEVRIDNCATKADLLAVSDRLLRWVVGTMVAFLGFVIAVGGTVAAVAFWILQDGGP